MLIESITLAQRDNKELEALIYRFRPLIRKCGRGSVKSFSQIGLQPLV